MLIYMGVTGGYDDCAYLRANLCRRCFQDVGDAMNNPQQLQCRADLA